MLPSDDGPPDEPDPDAAFGAALVQLDATAALPETVVAGLGPAWTNEHIADDSNAGPAVRALGSTPRLVWYQPGTGDALAPGLGGVATTSTTARSGRRGPLRRSRCCWPPSCSCAVARGRRLGRLVREPLPVVVRAIETTESRGRLYRRAGDRARAAAVLRSGTLERLTRRLAVGRGAGPGAVVHAAALATGDRPARSLTSCSGPHPPTTPP